MERASERVSRPVVTSESAYYDLSLVRFKPGSAPPGPHAYLKKDPHSRMSEGLCIMRFIPRGILLMKSPSILSYARSISRDNIVHCHNGDIKHLARARCLTHERVLLLDEWRCGTLGSFVREVARSFRKLFYVGVALHCLYCFFN